MQIESRSTEKTDQSTTAPEKPESVVGEVDSKEPTLSAPEGKPSEQKESSESETEETVDEKEGETKEEDAPKKKGGFQRRIDKLNARVTAKEQEAEFWKQQALKGAGGAKPEPEVTAPSKADTNPGKPVPDQFETHAEYVEALTEWKTEVKLKERDARAAKERFDQEQSKVVSAYTERKEAFAKKTPDFEEVVSEVDNIPLSPTLREIILSSENGPELAYELAKNPEEYERVSKLSPLACAREMGKLEYRLNSKSTTAEPEKKITKAPKPITPVGGKGGSVEKTIHEVAKNGSQAEYEALRRKQMRAEAG